MRILKIFSFSIFVILYIFLSDNKVYAKCNEFKDNCCVINEMAGEYYCEDPFICTNGLCVYPPDKKCSHVGDACCEINAMAGEYYCEAPFICTGMQAGANGSCSYPPKCGKLGGDCCTGNACDAGLICKNTICVASDTYSGGNINDAELPDYPDGVGFKFKDATLGTVIGKIIEYIYIFAGFALLIALLMGGFTVLTAAGSPEKAAKGYNQATYGVIGFILIFVSYMVVLLIQAIFHVKIFF